MIEELNFYNKKLSTVDNLKKWFLSLSIIFLIGSIIGLIVSAVVPPLLAAFEGLESGAITPESTEQETAAYFEHTYHYVVMIVLILFFTVLFFVSIILMVLRFTVLVFFGKKYSKLLKDANKIDMENRHKRKHIIAS